MVSFFFKIGLLVMLHLQRFFNFILKYLHPQANCFAMSVFIVPHMTVACFMLVSGRSFAKFHHVLTLLHMHFLLSSVSRVAVKMKQHESCSNKLPFKLVQCDLLIFSPKQAGSHRKHRCKDGVKRGCSPW